MPQDFKMAQKKWKNGILKYFLSDTLLSINVSGGLAYLQIRSGCSLFGTIFAFCLQEHAVLFYYLMFIH